MKYLLAINVKIIICSIFFILQLFLSCRFFPQEIKIDDPRIRPLYDAATLFDRKSNGFSPLPEEGYVSWESRSTTQYDAAIRIGGKTQRWIAFKKTGNSYRWIGEEEIFKGPHQYISVDGTFYEQIVLKYEIEHLSGIPLGKIHVAYSGEDIRLANKNNLTLEDIKPVLKEWKY